jgi:putative tricarboxylic transport membrane protein
LAVLICVNVLYIAVVERVGFVLTAIAYLSALFAVFRVRVRWIVPLAVVVTLAIHYAFYKLLRVPLPWGWLEPLAW